MKDIIITGASRGIGRALALSLAEEPASPFRLILTARNEKMLISVVRLVEAAGGEACCVPGDLSSITSSRALGSDLVSIVRPPAMLVNNAGIWPSRLELTREGCEASFMVNCFGPLVMQQALIHSGLLDRVMVISARLLVMGKYSTEQTPTGKDFSIWRTYCTTKLAFAIAERYIASQNPQIDFVVLHPGVVRTDLGSRKGVTGCILRCVRPFLKPPEVCASRLKQILLQERWSPPGNARWLMKDAGKPWAAATEDKDTCRNIHEMVDQLPKPGNSNNV